MVQPGAEQPAEPTDEQVATDAAPQAPPAADDAPRPEHEAVEGPEEVLGDVRDEAHQEAGEREALRRRVDELEAREKELTERLARALADFDNFRRRTREDSAQASARGKEQMLKALLPALDNLDRALSHTEDQGFRMIARQLQSTLQEQGVNVIDPEGEAFDAKLHEAIAKEAREEAKSGTVLSVVEKGYALEGRVLRPARVVVAE